MIHLCDIEQVTNTQDSVTGAVTESWSALYENVYCDIEPLSAREFIQSKAYESSISARITVPYLTGIDAHMRVRATCGCHSGKIYNIQGVLEDNVTGQEHITLPCSQGVNNG